MLSGTLDAELFGMEGNALYAIGVFTVKCPNKTPLGSAIAPYRIAGCCSAIGTGDTVETNSAGIRLDDKDF